MTYHTVNAGALQAAKEAPTNTRQEKDGQARDKFTSFKNAFIDFTTPGEYVLRLGPPWSEEGTPVRKIVNHLDPYFNQNNKGLTRTITKKDGSAFDLTVAPLCLEYVFANANIAKILIEDEIIGPEDHELFQEYGCPLCHLPRTLIEQFNSILAEQDKSRDDISREEREAIYKDIGFHRRYFPSTKFMFNAYLKEAPKGSQEPAGNLYVYSVPFSRFQPIDKMFNRVPTLFDPEEGRDMLVEAVGPKTIEREYLIQFLDPAPFGFKGDLFDLDEAMLKGAYSFKDMAALLENNRTRFSEEQRLGDIASVLD